VETESESGSRGVAKNVEQEQEKGSEEAESRKRSLMGELLGTRTQRREANLVPSCKNIRKGKVRTKKSVSGQGGDGTSGEGVFHLSLTPRIRREHNGRSRSSWGTPGDVTEDEGEVGKRTFSMDFSNLKRKVGRGRDESGLVQA